MGTLTRTDRPLTDAERSQLAVRVAQARRESAMALVKTGGASAIVCGPLALATLWASDAPAVVIAAFWSALWLVFTIWIGLPWRGLMRGQIPVLEDGIRTNRARATRLQSSRVVEFEEEEDEGACHAFELDDKTSVFIVGQAFYDAEDFPNSDFEMVDILGEGGRTVDGLLEKHGTKLHPERVVPARVKATHEPPDHLEVVAVPLEHVESALTPSPRHRHPAR
jgi:hypothetical protein